jgi:hypothetical protein
VAAPAHNDFARRHRCLRQDGARRGAAHESAAQLSDKYFEEAVPKAPFSPRTFSPRTFSPHDRLVKSHGALQRAARRVYSASTTMAGSTK